MKLLGVVKILYNFQTKGDEIGLSCFQLTSIFKFFLEKHVIEGGLTRTPSAERYSFFSPARFEGLLSA